MKKLFIGMLLMSGMSAWATPLVTCVHQGYLFDYAAKPLLVDFMKSVDTTIIGMTYSDSNEVDNAQLITVNEAIRSHKIEAVGKRLRGAMTAMKAIKTEKKQASVFV